MVSVGFKSIPEATGRSYDFSQRNTQLMAWLVEKKSGIFHVGFRFGGEEITRSLKTRAERTAQAILHRVEETIDLVERGRLDVPADAEIGSFLLSDGKFSKPKPAPVKRLRVWGSKPALESHRKSLGHYTGSQVRNKD